MDGSLALFSDHIKSIVADYYRWDLQVAQLGETIEAKPGKLDLCSFICQFLINFSIFQNYSLHPK